MVCVRSLEEMRKYWRENRDSLLEKYSDGYLVITYMPVGHAYLKTLDEVYDKLPTLKRVLVDKEVLFGTLPMLIDVRAEMDSERDKKKEDRRNHNPQLERLKQIREAKY